MRNIKFKLIWYGKTCQVNEIQWYKNGEINRVKVKESEKWLYPNDKNIILLEYTGVSDKSGADIYEGDLVKVLDRDWPSQLDSYPEMNHQQYLDFISSICEVIFERGEFYLKQRTGKGYYYESLSAIQGRDVFEIVGNIHIKSNLLK